MFTKVILLTGYIATTVLFASPCLSQVSSSQNSEKQKTVIWSKVHCCAPTAWPAAEDAVVEELESADVLVQVVEGTVLSHDSLNSSLEHIAKKYSAHIVLYLYCGDNGICGAHILTPYPNEKANLQQLVFQPNSHPDGLQTAVLRIVETVLAQLFPKKGVAPKPEQPTPPSNDVHDTGYRMGIGIGAASAYSPGGVDPSWGIGAHAHFNFATFFLLELNFLWALYTKDVSYGGETATFDMVMGRAFLFWNMNPRGKIHPGFGLGGGVLRAKSAGRSDSSDIADNYNEKMTVAYFGAAGRLAIDVSPRAAFVLNMNVGFLTPRLNIYFIEERAATYGRPLMDWFLGFEFRFL